MHGVFHIISTGLIQDNVIKHTFGTYKTHLSVVYVKLYFRGVWIEPILTMPITDITQHMCNGYANICDTLREKT